MTKEGKGILWSLGIIAVLVLFVLTASYVERERKAAEQPEIDAQNRVELVSKWKDIAACLKHPTSVCDPIVNSAYCAAWDQRYRAVSLVEFMESPESQGIRASEIDLENVTEPYTLLDSANQTLRERLFIDQDGIGKGQLVLTDCSVQAADRIKLDPADLQDDIEVLDRKDRQTWDRFREAVTNGAMIMKSDASDRITVRYNGEFQDVTNQMLYSSLFADLREFVKKNKEVHFEFVGTTSAYYVVVEKSARQIYFRNGKIMIE